MCRAATCKKCGKTTWAGCGQHVDQSSSAASPAGCRRRRACGAVTSSPRSSSSSAASTCRSPTAGCRTTWAASSPTALGRCCCRRPESSRPGSASTCASPPRSPASTARPRRAGPRPRDGHRDHRALRRPRPLPRRGAVRARRSRASERALTPARHRGCRRDGRGRHASPHHRRRHRRRLHRPRGRREPRPPRHRGDARRGADQVMAPLDPEMAALVHASPRERGVDLRSARAGQRSATGGRSTLADGSTVPAELVVAAIGVRPDSTLATDAGLDRRRARRHRRRRAAPHERPGHLRRRRRRREGRDALDGGATLVPLANTANLARPPRRRPHRRPAPSGRPVLGTAIVGSSASPSPPRAGTRSGCRPRTPLPCDPHPPGLTTPATTPAPSR
jgi:hypothetical protein